MQTTTQAFHRVHEGVSGMHQSLTGVLDSIQEQQHSVSEVSEAIDALDANIQNNAALVEKTSEAAQSLKDQAQLLGIETDKFQLDEQMAASLIQRTPAIHGIRMADVRQQMRIWRTNIQSYLNGVNVEVDLNQSMDCTESKVGQALAQLLTAEPSLDSWPEMQRVETLHKEQHQLVKEVVELIANSEDKSFEKMTLRDQKMDAFVLITNQLDEALANFNQRYFQINSVEKTVSTPLLRAV